MGDSLVLVGWSVGLGYLVRWIARSFVRALVRWSDHWCVHALISWLVGWLVGWLVCACVHEFRSSVRSFVRSLALDLAFALDLTLAPDLAHHVAPSSHSWVLECQGTRQQVGYFPTLAQGKPCDSQVSFAQAHQSMRSVRATQDKLAASLW